MSATSQGIGFTRMNVPYMLGTMFTPDRDRAKLYGFGVHLANARPWATAESSPAAGTTMRVVLPAPGAVRDA